MIDLEDVLYRREGDDFVPAGIDAKKFLLPEGHYHMHVRTEGKEIRVLQEDLDPACSEVHAVLKEFRDIITKAMHEASKIRPQKRMPEEFITAYSNMCKELDDNIPAMFEYETIEGIVMAGIESIANECGSI
jgi:hypothetical protein